MTETDLDRRRRDDPLYDAPPVTRSRYVETLGEGGPDDDKSFADYLRVLRRRKWAVLQVLVLVPLAAALLTLRQEPRYEASADVLITDGGLAAALGEAPTGGSARSPERVAQTHADLARVPAVAERALRVLRVRNRTAAGLLRESSVTPRLGSDLLEFKVSDPSPRLAVGLANEYARQFTLYRAGAERSSLRRAADELTRVLERLASARRTRTAFYRSLLVRRDRFDAMAALHSPSVVVVRNATEAEQISPRPVRNLGLGVALAVALAVAAAFVLESLDTRLRSAGEVGDQLGLPLLGQVRAPPRGSAEAGRLAMLADPNGPRAEAFWIVRANVDFANLDVSARSVLVTSALDGEGKSTTAANLAIAFARSGRRVVLVDLDLRHPSLDRCFGLEGHPGLTDVALGHVDLEDAIAAIPIARVLSEDDGHAGNGSGAGLLEVLPSGPPPIESGEFVTTRAVDEILRAARDRADLVFVDAPPLLPVGDARALSARVDAVIAVVHLSIIRRSSLRELRRALEALPAHPLGFVLTGVEAERHQRYGGFYRRSRPVRRPKAAA